MPKVSVIVPIFKAEKYLCVCIDSILSQSLSDWELLLIDDGSPDSSREICDTYAAKDYRIRVLHKVNGGVSSARNLGLKLVNSEWLTFVDSDDCLYPQALERMLVAAESNNLDLVQCRFNRTYKDGQICGITTGVLNATQYADSETYLTCVWGGLYKTSIISNYNLMFNENVRLGEDQLFLLSYIQHCSRLQHIGNTLYFYRDNEASTVNNPKPEYEIASVKAFKEMKQNNPLAYKRCDAMLLSWFLSLTLTSEIPTNILSDCYQDVRIDYISPKANAPERLAFYLLRISNTTAIVILRLVYKFYNIITLCRK